MGVDFGGEIYRVYSDVFRELTKAGGDKAKVISKLCKKGCSQKDLCFRVAAVRLAKHLSGHRKEELYGPSEKKMASLKRRTDSLAGEYDRVYWYLPVRLSPFVMALNPSDAMTKAAREVHQHFKEFRRDHNPKLFNLIVHQKMLLLWYVRKTTGRPHLADVAKLLGESEPSLEKAWRRYLRKKDMGLIDLTSYLEDPRVLSYASLISALAGTNPPPKQ